MASALGRANRRFAMADANWKSVGGAWTPESERFTAEQVEVAGMAARTEKKEIGGDERGGSGQGTLNLIPTVTTRGRQRSPGVSKSQQAHRDR